MNRECQAFLRTENLTKIFRHSRSDDVSALQNIDIQIDEGQYVLFRGHSGSGKTTLFTLLAGIAHPTRGAVFFRGENLNQLTDTALSALRRYHIGFILQDFHLFPRLTVLENASLPLLPLNLTKKRREQKAVILLEQLGLQDRLQHRPEEMSGGEQQRLAIARALVNEPALILADEPVSNIDIDSANKVAALFRQLKQEGKTLLITSHHDEIFEDADLMYHLERGRLTDEGDLRSVRDLRSAGDHRREKGPRGEKV